MKARLFARLFITLAFVMSAMLLALFGADDVLPTAAQEPPTPPAIPGLLDSSTSTHTDAPPQVTNSGDWTNYTNGNYVHDALAVEDNILWAGTSGEVVHWDMTTGDYAKYTTTDAHASNYVYAIAIDSAENKWFGTGAGMSKFDDETWTTHPTTDGLANNRVEAIAIDSVGNKWFGTSGGVNKFDEGASITYSISGQVTTDFDNYPMPDVTISTGTLYSATTDATGYYTITGLVTGTYTLTPYLYCHRLITLPSTRTVSVPPSAINQDFVDAGVRNTYSIVLPNLQKDADGISSRYIITNTSDCLANYEHIFYDNQDNEVTTKIFTISAKASQEFDLANMPDLPDGYQGYVEIQSDQPLTGTVLGGSLYSISGRVTDNIGDPVPEVIISTGGTYTTTTNIYGNYTINGLMAGTYIITPSKSGYLFSPVSLSISVPPDRTGQNFTSILCQSPHTGLDVCQLQEGDILFAYGELNNISQRLRMIAGTYWFHVAVWVGGDNFGDQFLAHATGPGSAGVPSVDQVTINSISETYWWTGDSLYDWAVIRPLTTNANKIAAANYARSKADQINPDILYNLNFLNKNDENAFYCSQLAWKAYENQGFDLEADQGLLNPVVTPDDLYYSVYDRATLVQANGGTLHRLVFQIHSPANMLMVDPLGRRTGFEPTTQQIVSEITGAYYIGPDDEPEALSVGLSDFSGWKLVVTGIETGTYTLDAELIDPLAPVSQTITLSTLPGQIDTFYLVDPDQNNGQLFTDTQSIYLPLILK